MKEKEPCQIEEHGSSFFKTFLLSKLRQLRESDPKLTENEPGEDAESEAAEAIEDAAVVLLRLLRLHDVNGLRRDVVGLIVGHDWSLLYCGVFC